MQYEKNTLVRLHNELIDIFEETIRVCNKLDIPYFIIGGTAIGAFYNQGIVPWDDDIDIGMKRNDYDRFIKEGSAIIDSKYEIQCFETEPRTPYYWIKVMKKGTQFVQEEMLECPISKGIFIDIFPFDNVPDSNWKESIQRKLIVIVSILFASKQLGMPYAKHKLKSAPSLISFPVSCLFSLFTSLLPYKLLFRLLTRLQTKYNNSKCEYLNIVRMPKDHIRSSDIDNSVEMKFDRLVVKAPNNIEYYLRHHYPWLVPVPPKEKQVNHMPVILDFGEHDECLHIQ